MPQPRLALGDPGARGGPSAEDDADDPEARSRPEPTCQAEASVSRDPPRDLRALPSPRPASPETNKNVRRGDSPETNNNVSVARRISRRSSFGEYDFTESKTAQHILHEGVECSRIRACSIWDVMRGLGHVLRQGSEDGITGDMHEWLSNPVDRIDGFLSHSWRQPRREKLLQLMLVYNLSAAGVAAALGGFLGFLLHWSGALPLVTFIAGQAGWACKTFGMAAYFLTFFFWGEMRSLCSRRLSRPRVFFDKYCINQAFLQEKLEGIRALGATILKSRRLVVLHSGSYFTRLWTVYEIACFMSVHSAKRLVLVPEFMPKAFAIIGPMMLVAVYILLNLLNYEPVLRVFGVTDMHAAATISAPTLLLFSASVCAPIVVMVLRFWHRELDSLQKVLSNFNIRDADCFAEADREHVYRLVANLERSIQQVDMWASDAEALESFNMRVQQLLAPAVQKTFGRVGVQYRIVAITCVIGSIDRFDTVVGSLKEDASARKISLETLSAFEWGLLTLPLNVACGSLIARCGMNLRGWRERLSMVACCLATIVVAVLLQFPVITLRSAAAESDIALALWLVWMAGEAAAIWALFRSSGSSSLSTEPGDRVDTDTMGALEGEFDAGPGHQEVPAAPGVDTKV